VKDVGLRVHVRVHGAIDVAVKPLPFRVGPPLEAEIVSQGAQGEVVPERDVALPDRAVHELQRAGLGPAAHLRVAFDRGHERLREDGRVVV